MTTITERPSVASPRVGTIEDVRTSTTHKALLPWKVIVWDDPINTMDFVVHVFQELFGFSYAEATTRMLEVHLQGKSIVAHGNFGQCEYDVERLGQYGLTASMEEG